MNANEPSNTSDTIEINEEQSQKKANRLAKETKSRARFFAVQALYQYLLCQTDVETLLLETKERALDLYDESFLEDALTHIVQYQENLDLKLSQFIHRDLESLDYVEHAILLLGAYEICSEVTPVPVVINETVNIAKKFGGTDSYKFINGVLDQMSKPTS